MSWLEAQRILPDGCILDASHYNCKCCQLILNCVRIQDSGRAILAALLPFVLVLVPCSGAWFYGPSS